MDLFAAYLKEREGFDTVITEKGFATYKITGDDCYLRDIYVVPDFRHYGVASAIADQVAEIARRAGCKTMTGSVNTSAGEPTASTKVLLRYGMGVLSAGPACIFFRKDI